MDDGRLANLRAEMQSRGLHAYIIPHNDPHDSEYIADHDARIEFICGFSGSAGTAVVTLTTQLLWTDSRYWLQAGNQCPDWELQKMGLPATPSIPEWLA